uniref:Core-binding (CB) domain-containing protein n=1 Tax=Paenibacillus polymyxa TaxID=1406 RepID=A0AAE9PSY1_PAEPO
MKKKGSSTKRKLPTNVRERDGKYSYRYYIPTTKFIEGEEKKSSKEMESPRFDTIQEAVDFGILIEAKKIQKKLKYTDDLTVRTWSQTWLKAYIMEREPAGNTIKNREYGLRVLLKQFGGFSIVDVSVSQYQDFLYKLKEDGKSRSTITTIHTAASLMFEHAKRKGLIEFDPTADAVIPKEKKTARKIGEKNKSSPNFSRRTN